MLLLQIDCTREVYQSGPAPPTATGDLASRASAPTAPMRPGLARSPATAALWSLGRICRPGSAGQTSAAARSAVALRRLGGQRLEAPQAVVQGRFGERRPGLGGQLGQAQVRVLESQARRRCAGPRGTVAQRSSAMRSRIVSVWRSAARAAARRRWPGRSWPGGWRGRAPRRRRDAPPRRAGRCGRPARPEGRPPSRRAWCSRRRCGRASRRGTRGPAARSSRRHSSASSSDSKVNSACTADPGGEIEPHPRNAPRAKATRQQWRATIRAGTPICTWNESDSTPASFNTCRWRGSSPSTTS